MDNIKFSPISMDEAGKLFGGFSNVNIAIDEGMRDEINNCKGGNCEKGCRGKGRRRRNSKKFPIPNGNCGPGNNCAKGCSNQTD